MTTSEEKEKKKPLSLNRPGKLMLKKTVETGQVRQSFSHGRSKAVTVEVKRARTFAPGASGSMIEVTEARRAAEEALSEARRDPTEELGKEIRSLTEGERATRAQALEVSRQEEEERLAAEAIAQARAEEDAARARVDQEAQRQSAAEAGPSATEPADAAPGQPTPTSAEAAAATPASPPETEDQRRRRKDESGAAELAGRIKRKGAVPPKPPTTRRGGEQRRRRGKLTISQALEGGDGRQRSLASVRRQREKLRSLPAKQAHQPPQRVIRDVTIPETITVQELANRMAERGVEVVKTLMRMEVMATINQTIDADTAELVVEEFGHKSKRVSAADVELGISGGPDEDASLRPRPPVVTVMGHVDHGKTSLLDALRKTDVASHEAGGITQHIGAYQVTVDSGDKITFIDTPGHAAFTEMRARGANVTDIVVLVVAADDGIMEQTVEAINHAKAAQVPIIVAINKMDRPDADAGRVKNELLQHELVVEEMGGEILAIEVSAKEHTNLDKLVEAILLQAELLELAVNPDRNAEGAVIEAKVERGRGPVATVLIQRGTLRVGDIFVAGSEWGRVRSLVNDRGETVEEAGPSVPVEVGGLNGTPFAGDDMVVVESDGQAREVADFRSQRKRDLEIAASSRGTLEQMFDRIREGGTKELPIVIKSDVHGSLEAISTSLEKLGTDEVKVRILHSGVGGINESDVTLAHATGAAIIGFNVRANPQARELSKRDSVDIHYYSIIYNVVDDIKATLSGMLAPSRRERFLGYAEIREIFNITKVGKVAGCMITEGVVRRGATVRLLRDDVVIHDGALKTLRRFKEEVKEVKEGYECGVAFENYGDIQIGDRVECYEIEEVAREL
ncbi:MAG: translation initiation factor IF-2 [Proteobacteria bacterium]|nr:translation initiation factor IF-2 [Pseudomonadota bacterium]